MTDLIPNRATPSGVLSGFDHARPGSPGIRRAGFLAATGQATKRTILQFFRTPQLLMMGTIQGALFLFVFRYILGGAIDAGAVDYVDFLVPGFLVTAILWGLMSAPPGIAEDAASGVHDRFRSLPIPRAAVVAGRSLADTALTAWGMAVTTLVGFAFGFRVHGGLADFLAACGLLVVASYAFSWLFLCLGLVSGNAQSAQGTATLIVVPITFISNAYVPADSLPGWMQPVADHSPVTVLTNAVRSLMLGGTDVAGVGHTTGYWVALSVAWCAGIVAVFGTIAVARFSRPR